MALSRVGQRRLPRALSNLDMAGGHNNPKCQKTVKCRVDLKETAQLHLTWVPIPRLLGPGQAPHWGPICLLTPSSRPLLTLFPRLAHPFLPLHLSKYPSSKPCWTAHLDALGPLQPWSSSLHLNTCVITSLHSIIKANSPGHLLQEGRVPGLAGHCSSHAR